jgi:hypothetical protein
MKRLTMDGSVLQVRQPKDKPYLYTTNPSPIHHKSNKIDHFLKIVDFYIQAGCPSRFIIEPIFGTYEPDIFFKDKSDNSICVEIQITPISHNKMQTKIKQFVSEYGKEHDSKILVLCTNQSYNKLTIQNGFKLIRKQLPINN